MAFKKSSCGDFGHGANETHKSVEAFAEHAFKLWGSLERIVHMSRELIFEEHDTKFPPKNKNL